MENILFDQGNHKVINLHKKKAVGAMEVSANQFVIIHDRRALMLDPGSNADYPSVMTELSVTLPPQNIEAFFISHQDPDVGSAIHTWLKTAPSAKAYISGLWIRFILHFGLMDINRFVALSDTGGAEISLSTGAKFKLIPAHFLHSPGNFHVYDPISKILFTGDLGISMFPPNKEEMLFVGNFEEHIQYMEGFHKRYIYSNQIVRKYLDGLKSLNLDIQMVAPQHGSAFKGENVEKLWNWLSNLKCYGD